METVPVGGVSECTVMEALLEGLRSCRTGTTACQGVTETFPGNSKAGPEEMEAAMDVYEES